MTMISLTDQQLIRSIADRAVALYERYDRNVPMQFIESELSIVHGDIVRLRLRELLDADDGNFAHDIAGIHQHLVISKKPTFSGCFMPRFADFSKESKS